MAKLDKLLVLLVTCVLIVVFALLVMLHDCRKLVAAAGRIAAESRAQIEVLDTKLGALRSEFNDQKGINSGADLKTDKPPIADFAELNRRLDQLAMQQSNILSLLPKPIAPDSLSETPDQKQENIQQAVTTLHVKAEKLREKKDSAKSKLEQLVVSLNVPDEVAALDDATGLTIPGLRAYWPYFEARKEWRDADDLLRIFTRKLQLSEIDKEFESAQSSENSK